MKQLVLTSIEITNFGQFDNKRIEFSPTVTNILGDNGTGKTTIYSALMWLMFGKDAFGRSIFDIKRLVDGRKQDKVDTVVQASFIYCTDAGPEELTLKRVLHEEWNEKTDTYKGDVTQCYFNGVPKLVSEYQTEINNIIQEEQFKMLTSVTYFLNLKPETQRDFLCKMAGVRSAADVAEGNKTWMAGLSMIPKKVTLDDYIKTLKDTIKRYRDDGKGIQPSINALSKSKPEELNWSVLEEAQKQLQSEIDDINKVLSSSEEADKSKLNKRKQLFDQITKLKEELSALTGKENAEINSLKAQASQQVYESNKVYKDTEAKCKEIEKQIKSNELSRESEKAEAELLNSDMDKMMKEYFEEDQKEFVPGDHLVCPLAKDVFCKSPVLMEQFNDKQEELRDKFNEDKLERLESIKNIGKMKKKEYDFAIKQVNELEQEYSSLAHQRTSLINQFTTLRYLDPSSLTVDDTDIKSRYADMRREKEKSVNQLQELYDNFNAEPKNTDTELIQKRIALQGEITKTINQLSAREHIARIDKQIAEITKNGKEIAGKITENENLLTTLQEIKRAVIEDAAIRINNLFQMVKWQTSVQQKNGDWKDVCFPTVDGVSLSLNTAKRINVGLDICQAVSNYAGIQVPLFIDGRESVNEIVNLSMQVVNLRVAPKGTPLTIQ